MTHNPHLSTITDGSKMPKGVSFEDLPLTPLPIDSFGRKRGMRSSQIHQSLISDDGRVWSASPVGLVCYDGVTLRLFGLKNGLNCHGLRCLAHGPDGTLWLGSDAGVEIIDIKRTAPLSVKFFPVGIVDSIAMSDGVNVIGTPSGLYCLNESGEFQPSDNPFLSRVRITSTMIDKAGKIWVTGPKFGLAVFAEGKWIFISPEDYHPIGIPQTLSEFHNQVLIGGQQGLIVMAADLSVSHSIKTVKPVTALHCDEDYIWIGTDEEVVRLKIIGESIFVHDKVLENVITRDIVSDSFNNIWISTDNLGIQRVSALRQISTIEQNTDLGSVFCIKDSTRGKLVGGASGLDLPNNITVLEGMSVWDAVQGPDGTIWAATQQGFFKHANPFQKDSAPVAFAHSHEVLAAPCRAIIFHNNAIYVGSTKGLVKIGPKGPKEILRPNGKSLGYVYSLHAGPKGKLWVTTLGAGLWRVEKDRSSPVLGGTITHKSNVYSVSHSPNGALYVSHDGYISEIDEAGVPRLFTYSREPVAAWSLLAVDAKTLMAGTSNGFVIYDCVTREIVKRVSNNTDTSNWEFTCSRSLYFDDGKVYCGVSSGLKIIDIEELMDIGVKPVPSLARVNWHQIHPKQSRNTYHVPAGKWRVEVELRTCWYLDEDDCQMRYRLIGFDQEWSTLRPIHTIAYTSLPIGKYQLEACIYSPIAGLGPPKRIMNIYVH